MSKTIDEKVVSMQFDNSHFEKNVRTSMSTLDKLKHSLKFEGAAKGFSNISAAAGKCDMSPLTKGVEAVGLKFNGLFTIADQTLRNIVNSAEASAKRIVSAFTIDPVKTGFNEYELKMGAVQTIMASTGEDLSTVNGYLEELNEYSDRTIYSFSDMTQNIGKFTNAGVKLDDAVLAMKGISNEAALSGANANEASRAMYNLSQAISMGYVQLIDWKSIELANMATVDFKKNILDTAVSMGTVTKVGEDMYSTGSQTLNMMGMFKDGLQDQWLTTDVLIDTLSEYADETTELGKRAYAAAQDVKTFSMMMDTLKEAAQSGWAQTWETVIGDFEEAKQFWTNLSERFGNIIGSSADTRNTILERALGSKWDQLTTKINDAGIATEDFSDKLIETAREHNVAIDDLIEQEGSIIEVVKKGKLSSEIIVDTLKKFTGSGSEMAASTEDMTEKLERFQKVVDEVWQGDYANIDTGRIEKLTEAGYDYAEVQELVNKTEGGRKLTLEDLSEAQLESIGYTEEQIETIQKLAEEAEKTGTPLNELIADLEKPSGRELLIDSLHNSLEGIGTALSTFKQAWNETFFPGSSEDDIMSIKANRIYKMIEAVHGFTEKINISPWDNLIEKINEAGISTEDFTEKVKETARAHGIAIDDLIEQEGSLATVFKKGLLSPDIIIETIDRLIDSERTMSSTSKEAFEKVRKLAEAINEFRGNVEKVDKLKRSFKGLLAVLDIVRIVAGGVFNVAFQVAKKVLQAFNLDILDVTASIGDAIIAFRDWLQGNSAFAKTIDFVAGVIVKIIGVIGDACTAVKEWVTAFLQIPVVKNTLAGFSSFVSEKFSKIKAFFTDKEGFAKLKQNFKDAFSDSTIGKYLSGGLEKLSEFFDRIKRLEKIDISNIGDIFRDFRDNVLEYFLNFDFSFKNIKDSISDFFDSFMEKLGQTGEKLEGAKGTIKKFLDFVRSKIPAAIAIGMGALTIAGIVKFGDIVEGLLTPIETLREVLENIGTSISKLVKARAFEMNSKAIRNLAVSILIIAGAIVLLATVDDPKKLWNAVGAIAAVMAALGLLALAMSSLGKVGSGLPKASGSLLALGGALLMMTWCLKILDGLDGPHVARNVAILLIMVGTLALVAGILGKNVSSFTRGSMSLVGMATAIIMLTGALWILDKMDLQSAGKSLLILLGLIGVVALLAKATSSVKFGSSLGLLSMVLGIKMLIWVMDDIAKMDVSKIQENLSAFAIILGAVAGLMLLSRLGGANAAKAGFGLIAISLALFVLIEVIKKLADLAEDKKTFDKGLEAVSKLLLIFGAVVALSYFAGRYAIRAGIMLMLMAGAMFILTGVIHLLKDIPEVDLNRVVGAISKLMLCFALIVASTWLTEKAMGTLITITAAVGLMAGIIYILGTKMSDSQLKNATRALMGVMVAFALLIASTNLINTTKVGKSLLTLGGLILVVAAIAGIIWALDALDVTASIETAGSISVLLLSLAGACTILSYAKPTLGTAYTSVFKMVGVMALVGTVLVIMSQFENMDKTLELAASLSIVLLAISGACVILSYIQPIGAAAIAGATATLKILAIISAILLILGSIGAGISSKLGTEKVEKFMDDMIMVLQKLGLAIGAFFGGLAAGATLSMMSIMPKIGTYLSGFMDNVQGFIDGARDIEKGDMDGVGHLASAILKLSVADLIAGYAAMKSAGLPELGTQLSDFYEKAETFITGVSTLDPAVTSGAESLANMVLALAKSELINAISDFLTFSSGTSSFETFTASLVSFGEAIVEFSKSVSSLTEADLVQVDLAASAGSKMATMAKKIPRTDGWAQEILGETDMAKFGLSVVAFGACLVAYSRSISGLTEADTENIERSAGAGEALSMLANKIPRTGGRAQEILGEKDMIKFGLSIVVFGIYLRAYAGVIRGLTEEDPDNIERSAKAAMALAKLNDVIPKTGGWAQVVLGEKDMAAFGASLAIFGSGLLAYVKAISELPEDSVEKINTSGEIVDAIKLVIKKIPTSAWWRTITIGEKDVSGFGASIATLGAGIKAYIVSIDGINDDSIALIEKSGDAVEAIVDVADKIPTKEKEYVSIAPFTNSMITAIVNVKAYITTALGITDEGIAAIKKSKSAIDEIAIVAGAISGLDSESLGSSAGSISRLAGSISALVAMDFSGVDPFKTAVDTLADTNIKGIITAFSDAAPKVAQEARKIVLAITMGLMMNSEAPVRAMQLIITKMIMTVSSNVGRFISGGSLLMAAFRAGLESGVSGIGTTFTNSLIRCVVAISTFFGTFYSCGEFLGAGLVSGINSQVDAAYDAGYALGQAAVQGEKDGQESESPSKATKRAGKWLGQGLVAGMKEMGGSVNAAGKLMGENAVASVSGALSGVSDVVNADLDAAPTIRPVIDFSRAKADGMSLSSRLDLSFTKPINSLSQIVTSAQAEIDSSNQKVVDAVISLKEDIATLKTAIDTKEFASYLDGKLVSHGLAKPMNRELSKLSKRGAY